MPVELPEAAPEHIVGVTEYAVMRGSVDAAACAIFVDVTVDHATRALEAATLLGLLEKSDSSFAPAGLTTQLLAQGSVDQKRQVFRTHLERFEPFAYVRTRLIQGFDFLQGCREAKAQFDLAPTPAVVRDVFVRWGSYARSFVGDPPEVDTSLGIDAPLASVVDSILDEGASVEEVLSDELGPHVYVGLDHSIRDNLLSGLRQFRERREPRAVAQPLGIAFEDFLRGVAERAGVDVATKNGIGQVAAALRGDGKLAKKHLGLAQSINAIRIASEHGIDQDENQEWQLTTQGVRVFIALVTLAIKSIAAYEARTELTL